MKNMETSKKLLLLVTVVWIIATIVNYVMGYIGNETTTIQSTYELINNLFMLEVVAYSGKSTAENITKIKNNVDLKIQEKFNNLI